jgi:hypothetical protein
MSHGELPGATANQFTTQLIDAARTDLFETEHGPRLFAAINDLYLAFANARLSLPLRYCPHCYTEQDARYVQDTPSRQFTTADAAHILSSVPHTLGTEADLNYFLPRLLEAHAYNGHFLPDVLPKTLGLARSAGWTDQQLQAVLEFMRAYIAAASVMEYNTSVCYEFDSMREDLKSALPELASELHVQLNDPEATQK